jgi:hypothetical protein
MIGTAAGAGRIGNSRIVTGAFWVGLILIFGSMFIYLATQDLSLRPRIQSPPPLSEGPVAK